MNCARVYCVTLIASVAAPNRHEQPHYKAKSSLPSLMISFPICITETSGSISHSSQNDLAYCSAELLSQWIVGKKMSILLRTVREMWKSIGRICMLE